ncbi:hypothetical protein [Serratia ureilytica]|uniref:hypothetical protein n=1 Tax=Serratia ureilytica TaxID=300181 RepID=UPI00165198AD|nr:hypothetical protein [Serratia ureilytica]
MSKDEYALYLTRLKSEGDSCLEREISKIKRREELKVQRHLVSDYIKLSLVLRRKFKAYDVSKQILDMAHLFNNDDKS